MPRRNPPTAAPLPLLLLVLLLHLPHPATASLPPDASVPIDPNTDSFVRPVPLLRQQSNSCPCTCSATDNPKTVNVCAGFPSSCTLTRCFPRTQGYGCCDEDVSEIGVANTPGEVVPLLETLVDNVADAVDQNPDLTEDAIDILGECIFDLEGLNSGIIPDEFVQDGSGGRTSRFTTSFTSLSTSSRQRRVVNSFFERANDSAIRVLNYVLTQLQSHIRSRSRG